ncbi:hypothetical protein DID77_02395 [Candidatus Marinamargulisbacteria bacterium SCGC AG-439-L15]|nr:hypothetical protein DID77_02395 [Candidatus Marinamargulisbacteria bacterium SCGC AG-439-L15]
MKTYTGSITRLVLTLFFITIFCLSSIATPIQKELTTNTFCCETNCTCTHFQSNCCQPKLSCNTKTEGKETPFLSLKKILRITTTTQAPPFHLKQEDVTIMDNTLSSQTVTPPLPPPKGLVLSV